ncbi:MAG: 6-hydroxynicotinate reductase [Pseudotabrizicola sp.]|uniref:6-hydroxynicotinate reductase n=1 Tax=Pseudotabrizicola sp. TaxID=2939647 RepID=UPI0027196C4F|nr:6-hydroxynicotinate reductase [Pseudotabrizicola sp.]MDO8883574.1 6-hydroxynicotinate reductase [Pseudotabrizicola sp.]MDP2081227.1 6-hydroxynicotinate reductase [Pseudotabrizicola sp.]MDZ7576154.1 6-hydroxynicotinate reductase [Pseudotabrizicola sp.]
MTGQPTSSTEKIRCDACPVMCYIAPGQTGACDRYANQDGRILRTDPVVMLTRSLDTGGRIVPFATRDWDGDAFPADTVVTGIGSGTTYPDYKPAPFIVASDVDGADMVTVVTEAIFSYCGVKVKIDTDRHLGAEGAIIRAEGEPVGHVTTAEYGSQMLSLGGVHHLTGGSKPEGRITCATLLALCNGAAVTLSIDGGSSVTVQAGHPPIVDGTPERRMRVGCGSATIGMFASQWVGLVDEVVVVDDHITGVVSEHQAGKVLGWQPTGIRVKGHRSTPGRYFRVSEPGLGWGGTRLTDPLEILGPWEARRGARAGLRLLMVSTTGEEFGYYELDESLTPQKKDLPPALRATVGMIDENCEPSLCTVLFMGGAGGSLRAGVTQNPVRLTRSVQAGQTRLTSGGAPCYIWPGGGITFMVDVTRLPEGAFGYVPTPALVAPLEFTLPRADYLAMGGHDTAIRTLGEVRAEGGEYQTHAHLTAPPEVPS